MVALATDDEGRDIVRITGLSSDELSSIETAGFDSAAWQRLLSVRVSSAPEGQPPVAGSWSVADDGVEFRPTFGFDPGRSYDVAFDRGSVPRAHAETVVTGVVGLAAVDRRPTTRVARILPTADVWPENHLRFYVEFTGPMSRTSGLDYVRLLDEDDEPVVDPFLPLDAEFWNGDHTRYTLFLDPGRVKRGILPNEQMGRALVPGRRYTIEVDASWRDEHGQPLVETYRQSFTAGPSDEVPVDPSAWSLAPPEADTRAPLVVTFPGALDHGLLLRTVGVAPAGGQSMDGIVEIGPGETTWRFTPDSPWTEGAYELLVLSILEDLAGNRVGLPFEVDRFDAVDDTPAPDVTRVPFVVSR